MTRPRRCAWSTRTSVHGLSRALPLSSPSSMGNERRRRELQREGSLSAQFGTDADSVVVRICEYDEGRRTTVVDNASTRRHRRSDPLLGYLRRDSDVEMEALPIAGSRVRCLEPQRREPLGGIDNVTSPVAPGKNRGPERAHRVGDGSVQGQLHHLHALRARYQTPITSEATDRLGQEDVLLGDPTHVGRAQRDSDVSDTQIHIEMVIVRTGGLRNRIDERCPVAERPDVEAGV